MHHKALLLSCLGVALASNEQSIIGSCERIYVTIWGQEGASPPGIYVTGSNTYSLPTTYQAVNGSTATLPENIPSTSSSAVPLDLTFTAILPTASQTAFIITEEDQTTTTGSSPNPTGLLYTHNGYCATNGATCLGWGAGECCSEYNSCGNTADYCGEGCQPEYGLCGLQPSPSPTLQMIPSPSPSAASCTDFATFYSSTDFGGSSYDACGTFGVCYNAPAYFVSEAASMAFNLAGSCTLFSEPSCADVSPVVDVVSGDPDLSNFANYEFSDDMVSYICYLSECPPGNLKRGLAC